MATTTPRVGFYMPADDGSEPIDVATDINDNLERLDNSIGFVPSTSSTPPASPYDGMATYETDTGAAKFRGVGGLWKYLVSSGSQFLYDLLLGAGKKIGIGNLTPSAYLDIVQASGTVGGNVINVKNTDEANPKLKLSMSSLEMGDGTSPIDVSFSRVSAGQINIVGSVNMSSVSVSGALSADSMDVTNDLDVGGDVTSDLTVLGKLSGVGYNVPNIIRKTADFPRVSTVAVADDPEITFAAEANSVYFVQTYLIYTAAAAGDLRYAWSVPAGTSGVRWVLGEAISGSDYTSTTMRTSAHSVTTEVVVGGHTVGLSSGAMDTAIFTTGGTAGNITLRVGQGTSSTDATTLRANTVTIYRKVE